VIVNPFKAKNMKKIRRFVLHDSQFLSNADMQNLSGGIARGAAICKKGDSCKKMTE